jgi:hypothetical protein
MKITIYGWSTSRERRVRRSQRTPFESSARTLISNFKTQEVKKDRDGNTIYTVTVTVRQDGRRISVIEIAVADEPKGIEEGQILKVTGLTAFAWVNVGSQDIYCRPTSDCRGGRCAPQTRTGLHRRALRTRS